MTEVACRYGCYGFRRIAAMLRPAGREINDKPVEGLRRCEGLKVPARQPDRATLWLHDDSCIGLRATGAEHVWSYDFAHYRKHDGRVLRTLNVLDEFTRESLAI